MLINCTTAKPGDDVGVPSGPVGGDPAGPVGASPRRDDGVSRRDGGPSPAGGVVPPPAPPVGPSCDDGLTCGPIAEDAGGAGASCCETLWVPGGVVEIGFSAGEIADLDPRDVPSFDRERPATIGGFYLDRFEVSLARFLAFARSYGGPPEAGAGSHPRIAQSGWRSEWNAELPVDSRELLSAVSCGVFRDPFFVPPDASGTPTGAADSEIPRDAGAPSTIDRLLRGDPLAEPNARLPMSCLSWFVAFTFCAWDGGRLPTETEWEYAAAGGAENRPYPWGSDESVLDLLDGAPVAAVGTRGAAGGAFGHDDLGGGMLEWVLDWFSEDYYERQAAGCRDCANLETQNGRGIRGSVDASCCVGLQTRFRGASRNLAAPGVFWPDHGVRCARDSRP